METLSTLCHPSDIASGAEVACHIAESKLPLLIRWAANEWPAKDAWSFLHLANTVSDRTVPVHDGTSPLKPLINTSAASEEVDQSLRPLSAVLRALAASEDGSAEAGTEFGYVPQVSLLRDFPELLRDIRLPPWLNRLSTVLEINLWIGDRGILSPLHFDLKDNLLTQLRGEKALKLLPPEASVVPRRSLNDSYWRVAAITAAQAKITRAWSDSTERLYTADLLPGDMIYIPAFWWHEVQTISPSLSVNFWWRPELDKCRGANVLSYLERIAAHGTEEGIHEAFQLRGGSFGQVAERLLADGARSEAAALRSAVLADLAPHLRGERAAATPLSQSCRAAPLTNPG